jgi:integrase/recombinase XerD
MDKIKTNLPLHEIVSWKWGVKNGQKHPVKMRITYREPGASTATRKYYPIQFKGANLFLSESELERIKDANKKLKAENKQIRNRFNEVETLAHEAIKAATAHGKPFTWDRFEKEFLQQESKRGFLKIFEGHLNDLKENNRIGTYTAYKSAFEALREFRGAIKEQDGRSFKVVKQATDFNPVDLTPAMLKKFEAYLLKRELTKDSIAIYMRAIRVIFNEIISDNPSLAEFYPFARRAGEKNKYKIKKGSGSKGEALTIEQLQTLFDIETTPGLPEHEARLFWLFSFHCQGMNFTDIGHLKYSNIKGDVLTYIRQKTRETENEETPIEIPLTDSIRAIINELGNPDKKPGSYLFEILKKGMSPEQQYKAIQQKVKATNAELKKLCEANDLPAITTYWARHSYANLLKQTGESVDMIREMLGHSDIKTTESYLKRFDIEKKRKVNERILKVLKTA